MSTSSPLTSFEKNEVKQIPCQKQAKDILEGEIVSRWTGGLTQLRDAESGTAVNQAGSVHPGPAITVQARLAMPVEDFLF